LIFFFLFLSRKKEKRLISSGLRNSQNCVSSKLGTCSANKVFYPLVSAGCSKVPRLTLGSTMRQSRNRLWPPSSSASFCKNQVPLQKFSTTVPLMKTVLIAAVASLAMLVASAQTKPAAKPAPKTAAKPAAKAPLLKTSLDSLSYAIGVLDASFFKQQGIGKLNYGVMMEAVKATLEGKPSLMEPQQADQILRMQMQNAAAKKIQPTIDACNAFLDKNRQREGIRVTPSGLQYEVIKMGVGPLPKDTNRVKVHYTGMFINGEKFESSKDGPGQPIEFALNGVIPGWTEGLQLMPVGSTYKFFIPYNLAYGAQGSPPTIPGGATLVFEVELLDIVGTAAPRAPLNGQ
jgi:FKBP-type peptidyl-prolyl cis-trans isomerase